MRQADAEVRQEVFGFPHPLASDSFGNCKHPVLCSILSYSHKEHFMYADFYGRHWYKGNLHAHTTQSDGQISPKEAAAIYRHQGYDFLSITDHWVPSLPATDEPEDGLLLLSGCEYHVEYKEPYFSRNRVVIIHINGIGFSSIPVLEQGPELRGQDMVDAILAADGIAIFNHPAWSRNTPDDIRSLKGVLAVEIYNSVSGFAKNQFPDSSFHVDQLALGGMMLGVIAADDSHWYIGEECRGYIMVQADRLDRRHIMEAIRGGRYFASQGPWVEADVKDRVVQVRCSRAAEIRIHENRTAGGLFRNQGLITGATYPLHDDVYYYRVEVTDERGNKAWTSPRLV
jgi:hypothetical protein